MADVSRHGNLAWLDLEMTGLEPARDVILQAAMIITNGDLEPLGSEVMDIWQPAESLAAMTPFVRDMHSKTGLLDRVTQSQVDVRQAEHRLMALLTKFCAYPATLCGNSVGTDKRFVERWMPGLAGYLHYRIVDVSSFKVVAQRFYGTREQFQKPTDRAHDALVDIENSIAEFAHYRTHLFRED